MPDRRPRRVRRILSILFAALPFAFALVRFVQTRRDLRSFWLALASGASAALGARLFDRMRREDRPAAAPVRAVVALIVSTVVGGFVAGAMTRLTSAGAWALAFFFALCFAVSVGFGRLSNRAP